MIRLHKRYFGRGATKGKSFFVHDDLLIVELADVFTTAERTLVEKGQRDTVRSTRQTFQSAMRGEFIDCVESILGRRIECYESVVFTAPDKLLEIFYLEPDSERAERVEREAAEDSGELERAIAGIPQSDLLS